MDDVNDPLIGRVIDGRFTIQSVLGRGGMGVVYRAHQASLERSVALKLMTGVPPEREGEFQRRFFLEAATSAKLKHPNTITVFDYGSSVIDSERVFFIAMELLDGLPLQRVISKGRSLAPLRAVHIALQISRSLREAHKAGVVHRDLKPGNVMIVKQDDADDVDGDFVKVLDFGLAKVGTKDDARPIEGLTKAGTFMGSPRYVAPEQIEGRPIDARADIYSLGCILFRMLAGRVPYDGKSPVEIMLKHLNEAVPSMAVPGLPRSLERLVGECLAKEARDRPASMDAVMQRLKLIRAELGGSGSGIIVVSDERSSLLPQPPVDASEPPLSVLAPVSATVAARTPLVHADEPVPLETRVDRRASLTSQPPTSQPPTSTPPSSTPPSRATPSQGSPAMAAALAALPDRSGQQRERTNTATGRSDVGRVAVPRGLVDDSTRPTRILGKLTLERQPQKPWAAITFGIVVGLVVIAALGSWRLGLVDKWLVEAGLPPVKSPPPAATATSAPSSSPSSTATSALPPRATSTTTTTTPATTTTARAKHARIRVTTTPPGADVLEMQDGLPKLLGVTPLVITWDVEKNPKARELLLRKEGFTPSVATLAPPEKERTDPVWLDVDATLRPH